MVQLLINLDLRMLFGYLLIAVVGELVPREKFAKTSSTTTTSTTTTTTTAQGTVSVKTEPSKGTIGIINLIYSN